MEQPGDAINAAIKAIDEKYKDPREHGIAMSRIFDPCRRVFFIPMCPRGHRMIGSSAIPSRGPSQSRADRRKKNTELAGVS